MANQSGNSYDQKTDPQRAIKVVAEGKTSSSPGNHRFDHPGKERKIQSIGMVNTHP